MPEQYVSCVFLVKLSVWTINLMFWLSLTLTEKVGESSEEQLY